MTDTMWFTKEPGKYPVNKDDPSLLITDDAPDWVELPIELGGEKRRVDEAHVRECVCDNQHRSLHLRTEDIWVCECPITDQFYWYKKRMVEVE